MAITLLNSVYILLVITVILSLTEGGSIGIDYGRLGANLPSPSNAVKLLKCLGIDQLKIYDANPAVLRSLSGTGIKVTVSLPNHLLSALTNYSLAYTWVRDNVVAYHPQTRIVAIAVGNQVFLDPKNATHLLIPSMENIHEALIKFNLHSEIKISSPVTLPALQDSQLIDSVLKPMLQLLRETGSYLMVNIYPFSTYQSNFYVIPLDYALFRDNPGAIHTGNGLRYFSLFDAQIDSVFEALSSLNYDDIPLVVSETGWPSMGDSNEIGASVEYAAAYNGNLVKRILTGGGTPLRPKAQLTVFVFALFNEDMKPGSASERNYGLFYPNEKKVYDISLTLEKQDFEKCKNHENANSKERNRSSKKKKKSHNKIKSNASGLFWIVICSVLTTTVVILTKIFWSRIIRCMCP